MQELYSYKWERERDKRGWERERISDTTKCVCVTITHVKKINLQTSMSTVTIFHVIFFKEETNVQNPKKVSLYHTQGWSMGFVFSYKHTYVIKSYSNDSTPNILNLSIVEMYLNLKRIAKTLCTVLFWYTISVFMHIAYLIQIRLTK